MGSSLKGNLWSRSPLVSFSSIHFLTLISYFVCGKKVAKLTSRKKSLSTRNQNFVSAPNPKIKVSFYIRILNVIEKHSDQVFYDSILYEENSQIKLFQCFIPDDQRKHI